MIRSIKKILEYQLAPRELEERFRLETLSHDKGQAISVIALTFIIITGFVFLDFQFIKTGIPQYTSVTSRCVAIIVSLLAVWMVRRQSEIRSFDLTLLCWVIIVVSHMLIVGEVRPGDYVMLIAWDILVIFAICIALPIPLSLQILAALFLTVGSAVLLVIKTPPWNPFEAGATLAAYLVSNFFGIYLSRRFKQLDRNRFVLFMQEQEAKKQLEMAMAEVKVLRGIIPICSFCKKIRNDQGYYEAIEAYVKRHTEADFSHTYCPECAKVHYSDLQEEANYEQAQQNTVNDEVKKHR